MRMGAIPGTSSRFPTILPRGTSPGRIHEHPQAISYTSNRVMRLRKVFSVRKAEGKRKAFQKLDDEIVAADFEGFELFCMLMTERW